MILGFNVVVCDGKKYAIMMVAGTHKAATLTGSFTHPGAKYLGI